MTRAAHENRGIGGVLPQKVIEVIGHESIGARQLAERTAGVMSQSTLNDVVGDLVRRGYLNVTRRGGHPAYSLTALGAHQLPKTVEHPFVTNWKPLVLPRVSRRAGSDVASKLPSMAAGQLRERRAP